jgi:hypothetical protein
MASLNEIINIQISRETSAVAQTDFNVPLFISAHTAFSERVRTYTDITGVGEDFDVADNAYKAAALMFGQALRPTSIRIGRRQVPSVIASITGVATGIVYTLTINGTNYTTTADGVDTAITVAADLKTAYDAAAITGITVTDNLDGTLTVASTIAWSFAATANIEVSKNPSTEAWGDTIDAVVEEDDSWYALTTEARTKTDILAIAANIEARKKVYFVSTADADVKTTVTTDVLSELKALGYQQTAYLFSEDAATTFPECAWVGYQLQEQPGSNTWTYKQLAGVTVSNLSATAGTNIRNKNGTTYEVIGGVSRTYGGAMVGGEWIDTMIFIHWLEARMKERLWFRMANSKKIPYTRQGVTVLEAEVRAQLREGVRVGGLADDPSPIVIVQDVLTVAPNIRAQRRYEGIRFEARLAGAIHFTTINGTVTV